MTAPFPEPDLASAANDCYLDLYPSYLKSTVDQTKAIKTTTLAFCAALKTTFPADGRAGFPIIDLLGILAAQASLLPDPAGVDYPNLIQFEQIVFTVYKTLWMAFILSNQTPAQITTAQAAAVLAAFNTAFNI